jgi:hypothetical protein
MIDAGRNMWCAYTIDVEGILTFKTFKGFKKKFAGKTTNK